MDSARETGWGLLSVCWVLSRLCSGNKTVKQTAVIQHPRNDVTDLYLHANDLRNFFFKVTKQSKTTPLRALSSSRDEKIIRDIFGVFSTGVSFVRQYCRQLLLLASLGLSYYRLVLLHLHIGIFRWTMIICCIHAPHPFITHNVHKNLRDLCVFVQAAAKFGCRGELILPQLTPCYT